MGEDERYMELALRVAELGRGQTSPNPLVGAVVVRDGEIVGQGAHLKAGTPHAEVHALRMAGDLARGATVYVTLEPCNHHGRTPPCTEALLAAGVRRVVVAVEDPDPRVQGRGIRRLREAGVEVTVGVLAEAARRQNEVFLHAARRRRPFVVLKLAATLDGRIAAMGESNAWVTGPAAHERVQALRRAYRAVAVGIGTVLADNPRLTVRPRGSPAESARQPLRVVFDSRLRFPPDAAMLKEPGETLVYTTDAAIAREARRAEALRERAEVVPVAADAADRVDLERALGDLFGRGIDSVLVEGGGVLAGALLAGRLVDKVVWFAAPKILCGGVAAVSGPAPAGMADAIALTGVQVEMAGEDVVLTGYPTYR
ncbi:bifunctional diaminohydroxyphosphoribosylaminopyrimidine deaminase/5-amino-6-(5-phosphoribosylamino)uracil reductase RibD [Alicyclobacillus sp.]|uniref:bifunctional diaminohydroxyphosphoribosylaminopyrimidine deaminase/5-amino-6-(5-phosphoribosylamino)uracil reductase RibD n=1 Tax=Alicyclobacillus sp. TaxID=61169 RepID=UPI0025C2A614|nr:bifunctional diaminohydroxyphosphoribosylaminopyrimidine deaminase/5-amino-6-(5-phosphoribosylamino)uracil reductase RibD [Alicyclobacillus sp.]MCL6516690.1 bifunctional diaminohydroxyphosphoribosylaminopyrimidine deaminase/5-amino-6-(5-phosphoribosylamino)uracil reductase RibD [Alicyclobacillus sp.]